MEKIFFLGNGMGNENNFEKMEDGENEGIKRGIIFKRVEGKDIEKEENKEDYEEGLLLRRKLLWERDKISPEKINEYLSILDKLSVHFFILKSTENPNDNHVNNNNDNNNNVNDNNNNEEINNINCTDFNLINKKEREGRVIGVSEYDKERGRVRQVAIREEYQRKGLGKQIIKLVEEEAKREKRKELLVHVLPENIPFYLRLGFQYTNSFAGPELILSKPLL